MIKKTITFEDLDGNKHTREYHFHMNKADITKMEMSVQGGMTKLLEHLAEVQDIPTFAKIFEDIIDRSYGVKTPDGGFDKDPQLLKNFKASEAYSELFVELIGDTKALIEFVNGIFPKDMSKPAAPVASV